MQCLVLVSGDLLGEKYSFIREFCTKLKNDIYFAEDPSKTIVKHVIEIMLFAIVLPFFALTCIAMMVMVKTQFFYSASLY